MGGTVRGRLSISLFSEQVNIITHTTRSVRYICLVYIEYIVNAYAETRKEQTFVYTSFPEETCGNSCNPLYNTPKSHAGILYLDGDEAPYGLIRDEETAVKVRCHDPRADNGRRHATPNALPHNQIPCYTILWSGQAITTAF